MSFKLNRYLLKIKILNDNVKDHYHNYKYNYEGDCGIDLLNLNDLIIKSFETQTIDFQIQCEMIDLLDNKLCSYTLVPRSSISNTPFIMANSIGIIDAGYRGNIMAKVKNISLNENTMKINKYFQILSPTLEPIKIKIVDSLTPTIRNANSFGSTS